MSNRVLPEASQQKSRAEVRPAHHLDITGIVETIEKARSLSEQWLPEAEYPYCMQHTLELIGRGLGWVAEVLPEASEDKNKIVGVILLDTYTWPWSRKWLYLENVHLWVEPKFRKGGTADRLLDRAEAYAREQKMQFRPRLTYGSKDHELIDRWMRMRGFAYCGGNFAQRLSTESP